MILVKKFFFLGNDAAANAFVVVVEDRVLSGADALVFLFQGDFGAAFCECDGARVEFRPVSELDEELLLAWGCS